MSFFSKVASVVTSPVKVVAKVTVTPVIHPPTWIKTAAKTIVSAPSAAAKSMSSIPIVGTLAKATIAFSPLPLLEGVVHGERLDHALVNDFKTKLQSAKEVAPYAKIVVANVPGIGTTASTAIGAGLALAEGKRIDAAMLEGIRGALPGGFAAQLALDFAINAAQGKSVQANVIAALQKQIPGGVGGQIVAQIAINLAKGEKPSAAQLDDVMKYVPYAARHAISVGLAVGSAMQIQQAKTEGDLVLLSASTVGKTLAAKDPVLTTARANIAPNAVRGFDAAIGLYSQGSMLKLTENKILGVRELLTADEKKAFDTATALELGRRKPISPPSTLSPKAKVAFYAAKGLAGAPPAVATGVHATVAPKPEESAGFQKGVQALVAIKATEPNLPDISWLEWAFTEVKHVLHF